jgi:hypothetical protein
VNEDLGDYAERIHGAALQGQRTLACMLVPVAILWTGINAISYSLKQAGSTSRGQSLT